MLGATRTLFLALALVAPAIAHAESHEEEDSRFELIGSISQAKVAGRDLAVVVLKDTKTERTIPVEVGKVFTVDGKVYRVLRLEGDTVVITDGITLSRIERPEQTASFGPPLIPTSIEDDAQGEEGQGIITARPPEVQARSLRGPLRPYPEPSEAASEDEGDPYVTTASDAPLSDEHAEHEEHQAESSTEE